MKKSLIPLVIVAAVLGGLVVLKNTNKTSAPMLDQAKLVRLAPEGVEAADVERIELYAGGMPEEKIVIGRDAENREDWVLTSYYGAPADGEKMTEFVEDLVSLRGEFRTAAASEDALTAYELENAKAFHAAVYGKEGESPLFHVLVGKSPDFKSVFMRKDGELDVYVETTNLRQTAGLFGESTEGPKASAWLAKTALDLDKEAIEGIDMTVPGKSVSFALVEQETPAAEAPAEGEEAPPAPAPVKEWTVASGGPGTAFKRQGLDNILARLDSLAASDAADPATKAALGLDPPMFTLSVKLAGQDAPVEVHAGRKDAAGDGYVVIPSQDPNLVYQVASYNFNNLFPKAGDLFELPKPEIAGDVTRFEISGPEGKAVLTKDGDMWSVAEPAAALPVQVSTASGVASALTSWQPADYAPSLEGTGLDAPKATLTFTAGEATHTIALGADTASFDGAYVQVDGGMALAMTRADVDRIFKKPAEFYQLNLTTLTTGEVQAIAVNRAADSFVLTREGSNWALTVDGQPAAGEVDIEKAELLAEAITGLRAEDIVYGKTALDGEAATTITLTVMNGDPLTFQIGAEAEGVAPVLAANISQLVTVTAVSAAEAAPASATLLLPAGDASAEAAPAGEAAESAPDAVVHAAPEAPAVEVPAAATEVVVEAPVEEAAPAPQE